MAKQLVVTVKTEDQSTGAIRGITNYVVNLGTASVKTDRQLSAAVASMNRAWTVAKTVAGGAIAYLTSRAVVDAFNRQADVLDKVGKAARQYGLSVEEMSGLKYGADLANVPFETVSAALGKANKNLAEFAVTGKGKAKDAFKELGLSVKDANRSITELLPQIADALNTMDVARREWVSSKLFGDAGPELARFLSEGSARLRAYREEAERLGGVFSEDQTKAAEEYLDALKRIEYAWGGLKTRLVVDVAPALTDVANKVASLTAAVPDMWKSLSGEIASARGGSEQAKERLENLTTSVTGLAVEVVKGAVRAVLPVVSIGLDFVYDMISARTRSYFSSIPERVALWIDEGVSDLPLTAVGSNWVRLVMGDKTLDQIKERSKAFYKAAHAEIDAQAEYARGTIVSRDARFMGAFRFDDYPEFKILLENIRKDVSGSGQAFLDAADAVFKWREALAAHAVGDLPERAIIAPLPGQTELNEWDHFVDGVSNGFDELTRKAEDFRTQGQFWFAAVSDSAINNLGNALTQVENDFDSLGDAAREFGVNTLQAIQQVTNQLIAMQIVTAALGGIGGFFGGAATSKVVPWKQLTGSAGVEGAMMFGARSGGYITTRGIQRFDRGGFVQGPDVARDVVPAMLMPGEGVLNRRGMGVVGMSGLARANRGEAPQGGSTVVVNNTFHISGAGDPRLVAKEIEARLGGMLANTLRREPSTRDMVRREIFN